MCEGMVSIPASYWDCWDRLQHHLTLIKKMDGWMVGWMDGWMGPEDFTMNNYYKGDEKQFPMHPLRLGFIESYSDYYFLWHYFTMLQRPLSVRGAIKQPSSPVWLNRAGHQSKRGRRMH